MSLYSDILKNDIRLIFRDKSLMVMFIIPVAIVAFCRLGIPPVAKLFPVLESYYWLIVSSFMAVAASTPSYIMGFILMDERDENVAVLLRILPLPNNFILKIRTVLIVLLSYFFSFIILLFNGLVHLEFFILISLPLLFALIPVVLTFAISAFAKNKIEAAAMYKGLNTFLILPVVAFFIPGILKYAFGIIPFFWTFNAFSVINEVQLYSMNFIISVFMHLLLARILYKIYVKKTD